MVKKIPWWQPQTGSREKEFIEKVIIGNFPNEGEFTTLFERKIAKLVNSKYAVAVTSGTIAIFLALKALGIGKGDEVIVPDLCFVAAPNAVDLTGATPVLVDVDPNTLMIEPGILQGAITKKTKAIIPVHISGRSSDMNGIIKVAKSYKLLVVEDAAEAFYSKHKGKFLGTFGDAGCFSFSPAKIITTGQGGVVVTDNRSLYKRLKELKDQGRPERGTGGDDLHNSIGYNFKFTNLQAAFGLGQLTYFKDRVRRLRRNHALYVRDLKSVKGINLFKCDLDAGELPLWTEVIIEQRDRLDRYLRANNIDCRRFWFPVHTQKPYKQADTNFPSSTRLSPRLLWLPSAFTLTDSDIDYVCKIIKKFYTSS